jgi:hypothetical protein
MLMAQGHIGTFRIDLSRAMRIPRKLKAKDLSSHMPSAFRFLTAADGDGEVLTPSIGAGVVHVDPLPGPRNNARQIRLLKALQRSHASRLHPNIA